MPVAAPAIFRRAPAALSPWAMLVVALHYGLAAAYNLATGTLGQAWEIPASVAVRWGCLTFLVSLPLVAIPYLLERLRARGLDWTLPGFGAWALYYGVYGLPAFLGSGLRSALAPWALGFTLDSRMLWQFAVLLFLSLFTTTMALEVFAARRRSRIEWLAVSRRLERDLERSRFELVAIDDRLRREAAQHLHGEVQSRLLMAWALLKRAQGAPDPAAAGPHLERVEEQLDHLRGMGLPHARELLRGSEGDRPLSELAGELVARFQAVIPVVFETEEAVSTWEGHLSGDLRRHARLLMEEAMLNAFRHAQATRLRLRLAVASEADSPELVLTVEDDGVGFEVEQASRGLGLSALHAELTLAGGRLEVDSRPGAGTRLTVRLPLRDPVVAA
ncbi:Sensor histidine kinase LiaS [compost metagenome]